MPSNEGINFGKKKENKESYPILNGTILSIVSSNTIHIFSSI